MKRLYWVENYEYRVDKISTRPKSFHPRELYWPFPEKYYQSIGFTVYNFLFRFKNAPNSISTLLNTQDNLINVESGLEEAENNLTERLFFPSKKATEDKITEYKAIRLIQLFFIKNYSNRFEAA